MEKNNETRLNNAQPEDEPGLDLLLIEALCLSHDNKRNVEATTENLTQVERWYSERDTTATKAEDRNEAYSWYSERDTTETKAEDKNEAESHSERDTTAIKAESKNDTDTSRRYSDQSDNTQMMDRCPVCYDMLVRPVTFPCCSASVCEECVFKWREPVPGQLPKFTCPHCNTRSVEHLIPGLDRYRQNALEKQYPESMARRQAESFLRLPLERRNDTRREIDKGVKQAQEMGISLLKKTAVGLVWMVGALVGFVFNALGGYHAYYYPKKVDGLSSDVGISLNYDSDPTGLQGTNRLQKILLFGSFPRIFQLWYGGLDFSRLIEFIFCPSASYISSLSGPVNLENAFLISLTFATVFFRSRNLVYNILISFLSVGLSAALPMLSGTHSDQYFVVYLLLTSFSRVGQCVVLVGLLLQSWQEQAVVVPITLLAIIHYWQRSSDIMWLKTVSTNIQYRITDRLLRTVGVVR